MANTILIIDDTLSNLQLLGSILRDHGYEVIATLNGKDGLSVLKRESIDLVLLDVMMPLMDGYEVCSLIKSDHQCKHIPVIFLTALAETCDLLKGFKVGGVDYVTKPFSSEELLARVNTHVELKKAREEIMVLKGIVPICASCKKIRDDEGYWSQVDEYFGKHSDIAFSHGVCPDCIRLLYPEIADEMLGIKE